VRQGIGAGSHSESLADEPTPSGAGGSTLILLPTYNEIDNLRPLVAGILDALPAAHILVIDDASPDGTGDLAEQLRCEHPGQVDVVHRPGKLGLGSAYLRGFQRALEGGYSRVVTMDADLSHAPRHLEALLLAAERADLVVGSRYIPGGCTVNWGIERKALSLMANVFARLALRLSVRDCTSGYRCYGVPLLRALDLDQIVADGYSFQIEMLWRSLAIGARVREVPIAFIERANGVSKISRDEIHKAVATVVGLRRMAAEEARGEPARQPTRFAASPAASPPHHGPELSILIVSYDTADLLEECLGSIFEHPPEVPFEVIVVDNGSPDDSAERVRRSFPRVRLLELPHNVGFARANNVALREAHGRALLLLNSDTRVFAGSLDGMLQALHANPSVGVVGCKQLDRERQLQLTWGRFPSFFNEVMRKVLHWRLRIDGMQVREYLDRKYHASSRVDWVSGSCLLARREAIEEAGLLDENIFLYFEDIDWCRRIQQCGWGIQYEPGVRIIHYGGESAKRHLIDALVAYRRSQFYFCRKYFGRAALLVLKALVGVKSLLASIRHGAGWLAAGSDREARFRSYCMLLTLKKILQTLFESVPQGPPAATVLGRQSGPMESLEPAVAEAREAR